MFLYDVQWINRDRFVLSAGHGSIFLYTWLHLAGYDLPLEEVIPTLNEKLKVYCDLYTCAYVEITPFTSVEELPTV